MTTVLVTGANRGIGLEFVRQYRAEGAEVFACCRSLGKAGPLKELGARVLELELRDAESVARLAAALQNEAIDILINNAGVYGPDRQSASESDFEGFVQTFRVNSLAPLMVAQALRANLMRGQDKKLIAITSKMGSISDSSGGTLAYRASKAALNMIMHGVAKEWAKDGIAVGIFHPGWVQTEMGGPGALITAERSVRGLMEQIAGLDLKNSGRFCDYKGREIGW
jgi:NAD(P)-dependent dehydrogenase (short-subunit alcohol dehydrogenase family)